MEEKLLWKIAKRKWQSQREISGARAKDGEETVDGRTVWKTLTNFNLYFRT